MRLSVLTLEEHRGFCRMKQMKPISDLDHHHSCRSPESYHYLENWFWNWLATFTWLRYLTALLFKVSTVWVIHLQSVLRLHCHLLSWIVTKCITDPWLWRSNCKLVRWLSWRVRTRNLDKMPRIASLIQWILLWSSRSFSNSLRPAKCPVSIISISLWSR